MNLQEALHACLAGATLSRDEAREVVASALHEEVDPVQLAGWLVATASRGETTAEIAGAVDALRGAMQVFEHPFDDAIDTCGTGGDGLGTFNLSTASAIVAAAAGARVIKHGNRNISSRCGSADLLERAGVPLELSPGAARSVLEEVGITFLFAPAYHPALRFAAPVRRSLGVRTIFNLLGPLANPGRVRRQLVGVGDGRRTEQLADVLRELGIERALVVHGAGAADELTLAGANTVLRHGIETADSAFDAGSLGLQPADVEALAGGDAERNLELLGGVLAGEAGPLREAVLLNTAAALVVAGVAESASEGVTRAREALDSGAARQTLERWVASAGRHRESA